MSPTINKIKYLLSYFVFWVVFFQCARLLFLLKHSVHSKHLDSITLGKTFFFGNQLDLSAAGYITILPAIFMVFSSIIPLSIIKKTLSIYTVLSILCVTFLQLLDLNLYNAWSTRLDSTILMYVNNPKLMLASVTNLQLLGGLLFWILLTLFWYFISNKINKKNLSRIQPGKPREAFVFLLLTASLIIPIRGGFQTIPINQSNVYFSNKMFANHAAVNFVWNFFNSAKRKTDEINPYVNFEKDIVEKIIAKEKNALLVSDIDSVLTVDQPNVILIIWESLTAKVVGSLGGEPDVTPNLNRLSEEGILFTNFYSNGDRTDKAIPAILSGYYPPPVERIMRMPNKTRSLPMLPHRMNQLGYRTSFYYGGDLNFGNMNTYLRNAEVNTIVDGSFFDDEDKNSKWGAYDDVLMQKLAEDLSKFQKEPFFTIALTLSSHEPFEMKGDYAFGDDTVSNKFRSLHHYTDGVIGDFINFAKRQEWYKNTLIVITSDHGHGLPVLEAPLFSAKRFQIPMLWLGGAVNPKIKEIPFVSSQVDFAYTLLDLLGGDKKGFRFSKNLLNKSDHNYAHYSYGNGFGTLNKNSAFLYDYTAKKTILEIGKEANCLDSLGKAITQQAYQDFIDRK